MGDLYIPSPELERVQKQNKPESGWTNIAERVSKAGKTSLVLIEMLPTGEDSKRADLKKAIDNLSSISSALEANSSFESPDKEIFIKLEEAEAILKKLYVIN